MLDNSAAGTPGPRSDTRMTAAVPSPPWRHSRRTSTAVPAAVYRTALRMTFSTALESRSGFASAFWSRGQQTERAAYVVGALLTASGLIHLAILVVSGAPWTGPLSLRKPTTFGLSFGLTLTTVTWVASFLPLSTRARSMLLGMFTAACVFETALVSFY